MQKTVLITGASSGFGKESSKIFHEKGWNVIATMRNPEKEEELNRLDNVLVVRLDVQDYSSIQTAIAAGIEKFGTIDALVNNAGYAVMGIFESATEEQLLNQYEVNVFGMMKTTQAVLPYMRKQKDGVIVNISSVAGRVGFPFASIYESSKYAIEGFSEALSFELFKLGIKVKLIEPGSSVTNFGHAKSSTPQTIEDYNITMERFFRNYQKNTSGFRTITPQEVASAIYGSVTDDSYKLRYVLGEDCTHFTNYKARHSESEFINYIQNFMN